MRALILSDIHANLEALEAVLAAADGLWDELWNLGDLVGYGGSPNEVIERIRPLETLVVRGNHDRVSCGLTSPNGFNPVARSAALWTRAELTHENLEWLREVPQGPLHPVIGGVSLSHGSPLDEDRYILTMRDAWVPLQQMVQPVTFFGHTHIQGGFSQKAHEWHELRPQYLASDLAGGDLDSQCSKWKIDLPPDSRHLLNPGSVGQPRDRDWRASFAIFETSAIPAIPDTQAAADDNALAVPQVEQPGECSPDDSGDDEWTMPESLYPATPSIAPPPPVQTLTYHRIPYDLVAAQGRILMAGLPDRLAARLREGR